MPRRPPPRRRHRPKTRVGLGGTLLFLALAIVATAAVYLLSRQLLSEREVGVGPRASEPAAVRPRPSQPPVAREDPVAAEEGGSAESAPDVAPVSVALARGALVAVVIDDLGRSLGEVEALVRLGVPLTYAVLPYETLTAEVAAALAERGEEMLLHLPMEPRNGANPGPGALSAGMSDRELARSTRAALERVPGATGVNNHMGSSVSADPRAMRAVLRVLAREKLYFLDSRTSSESVAFRLAATLGVPAAERQVFLDGDPSPEAVTEQFRHLLEVARDRGSAIAIGHPYPVTLEVLAREIPRAVAAGYELVPVSYLLERSGAPPP